MAITFWEKVAPWTMRDRWWTPGVRACLSALFWIPILICIAWLASLFTGCACLPAPTPTPAPGEPYSPQPIERVIVDAQPGDERTVLVSVGSLRQALSDSLALDEAIALNAVKDESLKTSIEAWRAWDLWERIEAKKRAFRVGVGVVAVLFSFMAGFDLGRI